MILAYTRDAAGAPVINLFAMSYERHLNTEDYFNFRGLFGLQGNISSEEKGKGV